MDEDDDSPGHETTDPTPPDHGSSEGLNASLAGHELVSVASTDSEVQGDHSAKADATVLASLGLEVLGSHADSDGDRDDVDGDPLQPLCEGSGGGVCVTVLYSRASADEGGTTSDSSSESGVAAACVGGTDPTGATCDGPIGAGVIESWSTIHRDGSGHTEAGSGSSVADVCLAPDPVLGTCTVSANAVSSEGSSDSRGSSHKESNVLGLELGGQGGDFTDPTAIAIPPDCPSPSLACVFLNNGETYLGHNIAGHAVAALDASALDGNVLAIAAQSETRVHKGGSRDCPGGPDCPEPPVCPGPDCPEPPVCPGPDCPEPPVCPGGPNCPDAGPPDGGDGLLPSTGGPWLGLLPIGLLAVVLGAWLVAGARRRALDDATE